jgi:ribosomal protein S4
MKVYQLYRRYRADLWGHLATRPRPRALRTLTKLVFAFRHRFHRLIRTQGLTPVRSPKRRTKRLSAYGRLLLRKQRFRLFYGRLRERQLRHYVRLALATRHPLESLVALVESRLATVLFRAFLLAPAPLRQALGHSLHRGVVRLNGRPVTSARTRLRPGDVVELESPLVDRLRPHSPLVGLDWLAILDSLDTPPIVLPPPSHLEVNYSDWSLCYLAHPRPSQVFFPFAFSAAEILAFYRHLGLA